MRPLAAFRGLLAASALAALAGCAVPQQGVTPGTGGAAGGQAAATIPPAQQLGLKAVAFSALPGWPADHPGQALGAFLAGCARIATLPPEQNLGGAGLALQYGGKAGQWLPSCTTARGVTRDDDAAARTFFETWFQPYEVSDTTGTPALFTGYYEPEVSGALTRSAGYAVPLYARPLDLIQAELGDFNPDFAGKSIFGRISEGRLVPYYDRAEIEAGALDRRHLEVIWLADKLDAFFLAVQGSGRVKLPDGRIVRVGYAGQNGRPYVAIGKLLIDRGEIPREQVNMQSIRAWLVAHPDKADALMDENPSYVFFRRLPNMPPEQGAPGTLGAPLTALRSLAVDRAFIPLGAPVFVATADPVDGSKIERLMFGQDLGGAIKGPNRLDIYFGAGPDAEERAGKMRGRGTMYLLLPRPPAA